MICASIMALIQESVPVSFSFGPVSPDAFTRFFCLLAHRRAPQCVTHLAFAGIVHIPIKFPCFVGLMLINSTYFQWYRNSPLFSAETGVQHGKICLRWVCNNLLTKNSTRFLSFCLPNKHFHPIMCQHHCHLSEIPSVRAELQVFLKVTISDCFRVARVHLLLAAPVFLSTPTGSGTLSLSVNIAPSFFLFAT